MKTFKKVLLIICVIIIAVGMFILGKNGLNYKEGYTQNILLETTKQYIPYLIISTVIILIYFAARYYKQNILKVIITVLLGILGACALALAVIAISRMAITRVFFGIMLVTYVSSIITLAANFEENT